MSYTLTDPDFSPALFPSMPARPHRVLLISLGVAIVTTSASLAYISHQIGQLPDIEPRAQPGPVVDYAALIPRPHGKLEVLTSEGSAPVVNVAPTVPVNARALSAEMPSTETADLIATLDGSSRSVDVPASVAGPGQVIEVASASDPAPTAPYLVAVPDEELAGFSASTVPIAADSADQADGGLVLRGAHPQGLATDGQ